MQSPISPKITAILDAADKYAPADRRDDNLRQLRDAIHQNNMMSAKELLRTASYGDLRRMGADLAKNLKPDNIEVTAHRMADALFAWASDRVEGPEQ